MFWTRPCQLKNTNQVRSDAADDSDIDMCDNRGKAAMMVLCSVAGYTVRELG